VCPSPGAPVTALPLLPVQPAAQRVRRGPLPVQSLPVPLVPVLLRVHSSTLGTKP